MGETIMKLREAVAWTLIVLTVLFVAGALATCGTPRWHEAPQPFHTARQGAVEPLDGVAGCFTAGGPVAPECGEGGAPRCPFEDGDPSGWPCLWEDPDTGGLYYVDSREYWD